MAQVDHHSIDLETLRRLLLDDRSSQSPLSDDEKTFLLRMGAVLALTQNGSNGAVEILLAVATAQANDQTKQPVLHALMDMAENGSKAAIDALYRLALEANQPVISQSIRAHRWEPSRASTRILFDWLASAEDGNDRVVDLELLSEAFFTEADDPLKDRILARSTSLRYRNWGKLMQVLRSPTASSMHDLVSLFPALTQHEQSICRKYLQSLAEHSSEIQNAICQLFIQYDDVPSLELAIQHHYRPIEPYSQALFAFLRGDQEQYQAIDFDHNLLITAYERSGRGLRRRLLAYSRLTGQIDWLRVVNQTSEVRWLGELSDQDWDLAMNRLFGQERFDELWRLAQVAPPVWSAAILTRMQQYGWLPSVVADREGYQQLTATAFACWQSPLSLKPRNTFRTLSDQILSLDFNPLATMLAAGTSGQPIYLWELPGGALRFPALMGPASVTRSVLFSQDGELVIAAGGDQRIRIFRHHSSQIIKTIEGHKGLIRHLALHPNGRLLVSTGFDGTLRFWRFPIGTEIRRIESSVTELFSLSIFANGDMVASGGAGDIVSIWNIPEGNHLRNLTVSNQGTLFIATTSTSEILAIAGRDKSIGLWNGINGNKLREFPPRNAPITGLELHPNEHILIASDAKGKITLLNVSNGTPITDVQAHQALISAIRLSADGQFLASADEQGTLSIWDLSTLIWMRMAYQPGTRLPVDEVNVKLLDPSLPSADHQWLTFMSILWRWIRRYEIEISEPFTIPIGEFDIEL